MAEPGRRRGVWLLLVAVLLLLLLIGVLAGLRPELGAYETWQQAIVHALWAVATASFGVGSFHAIVGAPGQGVFRAVRTPVGLLVGLGSGLAYVLGAFLLHLSLTHERTAADDDDRAHDWDWD